VAYELENGRVTKEQSSLNFITYLLPETKNGFSMFGESDEANRIKGGSSRLIEALAKAIAGKVTVHKMHKLTAVATGAGNTLRLTFDTLEGAREFSFARAICALPFTMLRGGRVAGLGRIGLSKGKLKAIEELGYGTNVKAMLAFKERIWRKAEPVNNGFTYTDQTFQCCWETSRAQEGQAGILTNYLAGKTGLEALRRDRFDLTLKELDKVFPGAEAAFLGPRVIMHWPTQPFILGSYSCALIGQFVEMFDDCATPELGGRLLFAGEHTSGDFAGFMNGAVQSGIRVAKELLALA